LFKISLIKITYFTVFQLVPIHIIRKRFCIYLLILIQLVQRSKMMASFEKVFTNAVTWVFTKALGSCYRRKGS